MNPALESVIQGESPLARLMGNGTRPFKVIPWPGSNGPNSHVAIRELVIHETRMARVGAIKYVKDVLKLSESELAHDPGIEDDERKTQILFEALRDPNEPEKRLCQSITDLRVYLTPDYQEALFTAYLEFQDERSPLRKVRSAEEVDELATALGKDWTREIILSSYDTVSLKNIVREQASRLRTLMERLCSATSSANG